MTLRNWTLLARVREGREPGGTAIECGGVGKWLRKRGPRGKARGRRARGPEGARGAGGACAAGGASWVSGAGRGR